MRIKIIGGVLSVLVSVGGAMLLSLVKLGNEAAKSPAVASDADRGPRDSSSPGAVAAPSRADPLPPASPKTSASTVTPAPAAWIATVNGLCTRANEALAEVRQLSDPLSQLDGWAKVTHALSVDLSAVTEGPLAIGDAAQVLATAADRYVFAAEMLAVNQRADASDIGTEADTLLARASAELAAAGATSCS